MTKIYIQLFLILILVVISLFLFFKYFNKTNLKSTEENINQTINSGESLIEDLKYLSTDKEGNEYKIEAKKGMTINPDIIYLEKVKAIISYKIPNTYQSINFAKYNTKILTLYLMT